MVRKWVHEREKEKKQKIWTRLHEKDQKTEDMVWRAEWGEPKIEKYPYRPNIGQKASGKSEQPDFAKQAAAGWVQHQTDQVRRQALLRDPNYQKWQQATGQEIEGDEDWHPKQDWDSSQNNRFGYLYSKNPREAREFAELVNRENRRLREEIGGYMQRRHSAKKELFEKTGEIIGDVWSKNAEVEAANSRMAMNQGLKTGEKACKVFESAGQTMAAQSEMNRQAADGAVKEIKEQTKKAVKHWGDANAAYSEAQTEQANKTGEFAERTKQHWVNANKSYSEAHNEHAQRIGKQAAEASRKYGGMWAMTSGVTGSDQTGASIHGYRNTKGHAVSHEASKQTAETIRKQIADGGIDVLGHAIAARGLSGSKTLDSYNKFLEYSATGRISDDKTLTPGVYSKIVDEAVADFLTKRYGATAGNIYSNTTKAFDDVVSVGLGPVVGAVKSAFDVGGESLEQARLNGANNQQAILYGAANGLRASMSEPIENMVKRAVKSESLGEAIHGIAGNFADEFTQEKILRDNSEYSNLVNHYYQNGFSKEQAQKIAKHELAKANIQSASEDMLYRKMFTPMEVYLKYGRR